MLLRRIIFLYFTLKDKENLSSHFPSSIFFVSSHFIIGVAKQVERDWLLELMDNILIKLRDN
ncbi:unnamed protein product [Coffea canephora]|uniref:Uncharacterized protein n=1 Tax=Coffea canephora TaxID=49390 RepID=A0A068U500_COFCA|nr:unnamed protein product [Coffea canephora]